MSHLRTMVNDRLGGKSGGGGGGQSSGGGKKTVRDSINSSTKFVLRPLQNMDSGA